MVKGDGFASDVNDKAIPRLGWDGQWIGFFSFARLHWGQRRGGAALRWGGGAMGQGMRLGRRLSEEEIGALIDRLHAAKIRPGLIVTALWHAALLIPPMALMPMSIFKLLWLLVVCGWFYGVMLLMFDNVDNSIWLVMLLLSLQLIWLLSGFVARRRWQAGLVAASCPVVLLGIIGVPAVQSNEVDWTFSHNLLGRWLLVAALLANLVIDVALLYYRRYRDKGCSWQGLIDDLLIAEDF